MKNLVARGMAAGAWGMASGLIYVPSRYASTAELIELAKVVAGSGGIYASHIRDEEDGLLEAIDEAIAIGKSAGLPVHISHLKANGQANWGKAVRRSSGSRPRGRQGKWSRPTSIPTSPRAPGWARWWFPTGRSGRVATSSPAWPRAPIAVPCSAPRSSASSTAGAAGRDPDRQVSPRSPAASAATWSPSRAQEGVTPLDVVLDIQRQGGAQAINFGMSEATSARS